MLFTAAGEHTERNKYRDFIRSCFILVKKNQIRDISVEYPITILWALIPLCTIDRGI